MSVKELSSDGRDDRLLRLARRPSSHKTKDAAVGQGAFQVADGSVVVRKDYKVLLVDVTKLPAELRRSRRFSAGDVAINVAATIMGCWTGDVNASRIVGGRSTGDVAESLGRDIRDWRRRPRLHRTTRTGRPARTWVVTGGKRSVRCHRRLVVLVVALVVVVVLQSFHTIGPAEVGLVQKRFSFKKLPADNPIAFHGEAGYQAELLTPGLRFKLWPIFGVKKFPWVQVPAGEIGVVIAQVGAPLPIGAKSAMYKPEFANFSDARDVHRRAAGKRVCSDRC